MANGVCSDLTLEKAPYAMLIKPNPTIAIPTTQVNSASCKETDEASLRKNFGCAFPGPPAPQESVLI
jgi:hypothetical protein